MIKSMTGFGSVRSEKGGHSLSVDIKCLNSKFMDVSLRIPKEIQDKEAELRKILSDGFGRGKIQVSMDLRIHQIAGAADLIDEALFDAYYDKLKDLAEKKSAEKGDLLRLALQMPDVIKSGEEGVDEELWNWIRKNFEDAIKKANNFRNDEGKTLEKHFKDALDILYACLKEVEALDEKRRKRQSERLKGALDEIRDKIRIDENRLEQELIYYLEKLDISEEKVRLKSHLDYFNTTLNEKESNGKRLQFISQEIGREINTIGSKANDADIQKVVVQMKDELEKIKEQSLNVI